MLLDGDASVMMHLAEFETAVRYNMPLLVVVMNNEALGAEYYKLDAHKMEARGSEITTPDLGKVAVSFGGRGKHGDDHRRADLGREGVRGEARPDDDRPAHLEVRAERALPARALRPRRVRPAGGLVVWSARSVWSVRFLFSVPSKRPASYDCERMDSAD